MRIVHVVAYVDEVGSYGGPLRVAVNQATELRSRGHDVVLVAGAARGLAPAAAARSTGGLPTVLRRSRQLGRGGGFAARWAPGVHLWLLRNARGADVVHVHLGRDLTTAPAAALLRLLRVPYVVQTHGMVDTTSNRVGPLVDGAVMRPVVRAARRVLALTGHEVERLRPVTGPDAANVALVPNGVSAPSDRPEPQGPPGLPEVLFLSRLHHRKRPLAFVRAAQQLRAEGVQARFTVVGPDEGELAAVEAALRATPDPDGLVTYGGVVPMDATAQRMADADVFVLPSVDEPFPMALAEAMAQGMPVVCTRSNGLASYVVEGDAGIVVPDDDHDALVAALRELVTDTDGARRRGRNGAAVVRQRLSIAAVASRLEELYAGRTPVPSG